MSRRESREPSKLIGALGVVFGDIGTSTLYALPAAFWLGHFETSRDNILGIVSLVLWAVTVIVAVKYVGLMMRASNDGEGGIMALVALIRRAMQRGGKRRAKQWGLVGLVGVALFYGDSVITPAISVLSAVEGLQVSLPTLAAWTVPISLIALVGLFAAQSRGTGRLGRWFGPIMLLWFAVSAVAGLLALLQRPEVLVALSPLTALGFVMAHPASAFVAMGAVVLSVTGAEALYADMGHFGRQATMRSWFLIVYPALLLNYLGQGAFLLGNPEVTTNIFFWLYPSWAQVPMVILATFATLIASQSVIAGAFSLTRQAVQLGYLPQLHIRHTSESAGQIYIAGLNWLMCIAVAVLVIAFGSSTRLADAYGMAESGTLFASTILLMVAAPSLWPRRKYMVYALGAVFAVFEVAFIAACSMKLVHGAWIPLAIAAGVLLVLTTWARGSELVSRERRRREGNMLDYIKAVRQDPSVLRAPGSAVYLAHHPGYTPLAMRATVERLHELSKSVAVVTVYTATVPHVPPERRAVVDHLGDIDDGIVQIGLTFGFNDVPNVPLALAYLQDSAPELSFEPQAATYFISDSSIALAKHGALGRVRARLFAGLHRLSAPSPDYFKLPVDRTIDMTSYISL